MKLFLDTTNSKFIIALINNNKVVKLQEKVTNRDMVKNANKWMSDFLKKNEIDILKLTEIYLTIGPGSFTGTKVGYNIARTLLLAKPKLKINTISSLDLISNDDKLYTVLQITSKKYIVQKEGLFTRRIETKTIDKYDKELIQLGYEGFNKSNLEYKIQNNYFKRIRNINKIKLIF